MTGVRWGIVGAGRIAHTFARDIAHAPHAELVAVAARRLSAADDFAAQYGIPRTFEGYASLYADPGVDAVYVATPHTLHLEHSADALGAGKAVLCEKPITVSADECRSLIEVWATSGAYLMEAMWTWFLPAIQTAKAWLDGGRIGELRHIKADFGFAKVYAPDKRVYDAELGGGCLLEMGVYPVALAYLVSGLDPDDVKVIARHAPNGVEDDVVMLFDYADAVATLATSYKCKLQNWAYLIGTDGYVAIPDFWRASECHLYRLDERIDSYIDGRKGSGFEYQIESVSNDLLAGRRESDTMPLRSSLAVQRHMDRVRAAFGR